MSDRPLVPGTSVGAPVPLAAEHVLDGFGCGEASLDAWLKTHARRGDGKFARTYVVCSGRDVVGYYCLSAGAVDRMAAPGKLRRNAPDPIPVAILGRLAIDRAWTGRGLGAALLADALRRVAGASDIIGISAVMIHALDAAAEAFYRKQAEFLAFPDGSRTLFLPIATIVAAL